MVLKECEEWQKETWSSTARLTLAEIFHPWVLWEAPGSGFESSSGGAWKSGILPRWDRARKNRFSNGLGHNRSKVSETWAETESFHTNFSRSRQAKYLRVDPKQGFKQSTLSIENPDRQAIGSWAGHL